MVSTEVLIHEGNMEDLIITRSAVLILNQQLEGRRQTDACSNITLEDICMHVDSPTAALASKANWYARRQVYSSVILKVNIDECTQVEIFSNMYTGNAGELL